LPFWGKDNGVCAWSLPQQGFNGVRRPLHLLEHTSGTTGQLASTPGCRPAEHNASNNLSPFILLDARWASTQQECFTQGARYIAH